MSYDSLNLGKGSAGKTVRAVYRSQVTNQAFIPATGLTEAWDAGSVQDYAVAAAEVGGVGASGIYSAQTPAAVPVPYVWDMYESPGGVVNLFQHLGSGRGGEAEGGGGGEGGLTAEQAAALDYLVKAMQSISLSRNR